MEFVWINYPDAEWGELSSSYRCTIVIETRKFMSVDDYYYFRRLAFGMVGIDNDDWMLKEVEILRIANLNKFLQNPKLKDVLLDTRNRPLFNELENWVSPNIHNQVLTEIRSIIRCELRPIFMHENYRYLKLINSNIIIGNFDMSLSQCTGIKVIIDLFPFHEEFPILPDTQMWSASQFHYGALVGILIECTNKGKTCYIYGRKNEYVSFFSDYLVQAFKISLPTSKEIVKNMFLDF